MTRHIIAKLKTTDNEKILKVTVCVCVRVRVRVCVCVYQNNGLNNCGTPHQKPRQQEDNETTSLKC